MTPDTARTILLALRNHRRPPRTRAARVMDALTHIKESKKGKPARGRISAGLNIGINYDERTDNITLPTAKNHPADV
jgi:hypothetical protein